MSTKWKLFFVSLAIAGSQELLLGETARAQVVSTSFQNGAFGYTGTFDRKISENAANDMDGANVAQLFLDGYQQAAGSTAASPDEQGLIRFDGIIGNGPRQVPANATILDAKLTVTTSPSGNAQTSGPFGVAGLLQPFNSSTTYFGSFTSATDFGSRGAWWQDGYATRPTGGFGFQNPGDRSSANIHSVVQSWANGGANHGLVIQAGIADTITASANTADGWSIHTTGYPFVDARPKLEVTYTTAPVTTRTFQRGANGYTGDTIAIVRSGLNALIEDTADPTRPEITEDASLLDQTFLDGVLFSNQNGDTSSADDFALMKFGGVFAAGQAPTNVPVAKAWLVLTTGEASNAAYTPGPFTVHKMLRTWDFTTLHSSLGAIDGLQVADGDISPELDSLDGFVRGAEAWFDITDYLEGVRTGAVDNGLAVMSGGTADGWQIHTNGATNEAARPKLIVYSADLGITGPDPGDFNDDGFVDGADFLAWQRGFGTTYDAADLADWKVNFGMTGGGAGAQASTAAVPEPVAALISVMAALGLLATSRQGAART